MLFKGVENVYTQHTPHLSQTLGHLFRGRLKETSYPFLESPSPNASLQRSVVLYHPQFDYTARLILIRPQDVIIFMIGGTTYEEARTITLLTQDPAAASNAGIPTAAGTRLLLGGTCVHNSSSYVKFPSVYLLPSLKHVTLKIYRNDSHSGELVSVLCL